MNRLNYILILALVVLFAGKSLAADSLQLQAERAYTEKRYKEAIKNYEALVQEGYSSYKLFYNLGNAYYKNNEIGQAIYHYELANKLKPNDEDIKVNLTIANNKTIDQIDSKENFFLGIIKHRLVNLFSTQGWAWLSIISFISFLSLIFLFVISNHIMLKRLGFVVGILSLFLFFSSMSLGFSALRNKQHIKFAIIIAREIKIYEEPDAASTSKFSLHEGTKVKVLDTNPDWTNIVLENGNEGWVKTAAVGLI